MGTFHPRPRHRRPVESSLILAIALISFLDLPSRAAAAQAASPPTSYAATILGVEAADFDVLVSVAWGDDLAADEPVFLSLTDRNGEVVGSSWLLPHPGEVSVEELPNALVAAPARPQHHDSHLSDADGVALAASYPLQVGLQCDGPESCEFNLRGGISAPEMIVLSRQMADALAQAEAAGATDPLGWAAQTYPELYGDIYGLQWQIRSLGGTVDEATGCSCFWTLRTEKEDFPDSEGTCGGTHDIEYRRTGILSPLLEVTASGRSSLTPNVGCWQVAQTESNVIVVSGSEIPFEGTGIESCAMECGGSAVFTGEYEVDLAAAATTKKDRASILDAVNFTVDGAPVFGALTGLQSNDGIDRIDHAVTFGTLFSAPGATADMVSGATVRLEYESSAAPSSTPNGAVAILPCGNASPPVACAMGRSKGVHRIFVEAQSTCTGQLLYDAYSTFSSSTSDKVGGDDIRILVGKCDG